MWRIPFGIVLLVVAAGGLDANTQAATADKTGSSPAEADHRAQPPSHSGWRGGIGITFGAPSREIADVTELGYEIVWGGGEVQAAKALDVAVFSYWNSVVETSLKDPGGRYDFSRMADKNEAARLAFDAWTERSYGVKGLSRYASVRYRPDAPYGDVYGSMDLSSENDLVKAVIAKYLKWFDDHGIRQGGIGLDNAGKVPRAFLEALQRQLRARGLGIAANGCPDDYLSLIDFFGNEGFPFTLEYARQARTKGFRGILGEFTMQHLSGGELESYLASKLFNGIVFFGYTDGGTAAGAHYSAYTARPDVYNHQRWVFRKYVPLSRAVQQAGRQNEPGAWFAAGPQPKAGDGAAATPAPVPVNREGKVLEVKTRDANLNRITGRSPNTPSAILQFGREPAQGIYLFVDSADPSSVVCDARQLGVQRDTIVFDEFAERPLESRLAGEQLTFRTEAGPRLVQMGSRPTIAGNLLARIEESLREQLRQRTFDQAAGVRPAQKAWAKFCQGWTLDRGVARTGQCSLKLSGGTYTGPMPQWKYFNRQGAAQFLNLNQTVPQPIVLRACSKAENVAQADPVLLDTFASRRRHFDAREGHTYAMLLYLDYQDGAWPEVRSVSFAPGTHDWEPQTIEVRPVRPVKTALVLLEFHQPQGTAWFDDVSLSQGPGPAGNLLVASGFEEDPRAEQVPRNQSVRYEEQLRSFLQALQAARTSPAAERSQSLPALERQCSALSEWLRTQGLDSYWTREVRDLADTAAKLQVCSRVVGE